MSEERPLVVITRDLKVSGKLGTFGSLVYAAGKFSCRTLERPRPGFVEDHPCIDPSEEGYDVDFVDTHPHHNPCFEVMRVKGRTAILIHAANWFQELLGCISLGLTVEVVAGKLHDGTPINQMGVTASGPTLRKFLDVIERRNFRLIIREVA